MRSRNISVSIILQNIAQLKALFEKQWESILGNCDELLYLGGNEASTHKLISESYLGKSTLWLDSYGKSEGHSGSYTTNYSIIGRELLTPDEVRMLDNRYALLFIRGERPILDEKYDILKHPNVALTTDGKAPPYEAWEHRPGRGGGHRPADVPGAERAGRSRKQSHYLNFYPMKKLKHCLNQRRNRLMNKKQKKLTQPKTLGKGGRRAFALFAVSTLLVGTLTTTAFATAGGDPLTVVNNLSDFIFGLIRAVGIILLGWGVVQVGLSVPVPRPQPALPGVSHPGGRQLSSPSPRKSWT